MQINDVQNVRLVSAVCPFQRIAVAQSERKRKTVQPLHRRAARNSRAGDFNRDSAVFIPHLGVAVALISANAKTIGIDGGAGTTSASRRWRGPR